MRTNGANVPLMGGGNFTDKFMDWLRTHKRFASFVGIALILVPVIQTVVFLLQMAGLVGRVPEAMTLLIDHPIVVSLTCAILGIVAFVFSAHEARKHADEKAEEVKKIVSALHSRFDEQASSIREKIKEAHRLELEELARWSEMATQLANIARRYRLIAAVRESRENLRRALAECEGYLSAPSMSGGVSRTEANSMRAVESGIRHLATTAAHLDPESKYPIAAPPLDSDINAARPPHEEKLSPHVVTFWRTNWLHAGRAMTMADALCADLDAQTMRMETNLVQNVATKTAT